MRIFKKKKYGVINVPFIDNKDIPIVPDGAWVKCDHCGKILYKKITTCVTTAIIILDYQLTIELT